MPAIDLTTYSGLIAAVARYLDRTDLAGDIPAFIQLAEAQIARVLRRTTLRATYTVFGASHTLAADVAELRSLRLVTGSPKRDLPILIVTPEILAERRAGRSSTGRPTYAAVVGRELMFVPACDKAYSLEATYFAKLVPLSATAASNVVLVEAPDAYLFGALKESASFLDHDERIAAWESKFNTALTQLERVRVGEESNASLRPARLPRTF